MILVFCCWFVERIQATSNYTALREKWKQLVRNSSDPNRNKYLLPKLNAVAGVYDYPIDNPALSQIVLNKTVVVLVAEITEPNNSNERYRRYLFNFLCILKHFRLKAALFIIPPKSTYFESIQQEIHAFYKGVEVVSFPYDLFWAYIARKSSPTLEHGTGKADYEGEVPNFHHFGALPMLIPVMEVLQLGYHTVSNNRYKL